MNVEGGTSRHVDVLFSLKTALDYGQSLGRIQLQKNVYLADTLSVLWSLLTPRMGHETYKNGPYDPVIQNTVDVLAFRGFVLITKVRFSDGGTQVGYQLSETGIQLFNLCIREKYFAKKYALYSEIARQIDKRGWTKLKSMTYKEPNYLEARTGGWGRSTEQVGILENISARILVDFKKMVADGRELNPKSIVSLFFKFLD